VSEGARSQGGGAAGFFERVRRANAPVPPEQSIAFRFVTTVAVVTGIIACESVGELSAPAALVATLAVVAGMVFSYASRNRPHQWVKVLLAGAVIAVFGWFVSEILHAAGTGQLSSIEIPLAGLFTWVQAIHAFDVPARRDLLFSFAGASALVTVASAQALSQGFLVFVVVLLLCVIAGLGFSWRSMTGSKSGLSLPLLAGSLGVVVVVALGLMTVLPAPHASQSLRLPSSLTRYLPLPGNGALAGGNGSNPTEPSRAGLPGGKVGIGGYIGGIGILNTANRYSLSSKVIMQVRADTPGYFLGLTYDTWNGQSWLPSRHDKGLTKLSGSSPFEIPISALAGRHVRENVQTFYVQAPLPNLLFATSDPAQVYFPAGSLVVGHDGSLRSTVAMTPGTVYTVVSADTEVAPSVLAHDKRPLSARVRAFPAIKDALQLPYAYRRVAALSRRIVARRHATTTVAKVEALEAWIAHHTKYTTDVPPLRAGQDAVNQFLFGARRGYCEQISTALAVMLRTLHIPAREAVGYVPGPFDPLSDLYEIQARDAHAWVQVYFPGFGWQNFDPTAKVPLAPDSPGNYIAHVVFAKLASLPLVPVGAVAGAGLAGYGAVSLERRRRRLPRSWAGRAGRRLERLGSRLVAARADSETLTEFAARLDLAHRGLGLEKVAREIEAAYYAAFCDESFSPPPSRRRQVETALSGLARAARWKRPGSS
jgi:transglutaminase-like putative cysteine protease